MCFGYLRTDNGYKFVIPENKLEEFDEYKRWSNNCSNEFDRYKVDSLISGNTNLSKMKIIIEVG